MKILIVASTLAEIAPFLTNIGQHVAIEKAFFTANYLDLEMAFLIVGIGSVPMSTKLAMHLASYQYDLVMNAGIAGAFKGRFAPGNVVMVHSEVFGDLGIEHADGSFSDIFEVELCSMNEPPFDQGRLLCHDRALDKIHLPLAKGLTVNKVHGSEYSIKHLTSKYDADIESMEGAAFFYVCLMMHVRFLEIRAISNIVEKRNRELWQIDRAVQNLAGALITLLPKL